MNVKFKGNTTTYKCTEPVEQKLFRAGEAVGWAIVFHIYNDATSSEVDDIITPETVSELVFSDDDEEGISFTITGYSNITSCIIRHKAAATVVELQLTKANYESEGNKDGEV